MKYLKQPDAEISDAARRVIVVDVGHPHSRGRAGYGTFLNPY